MIEQKPVQTDDQTTPSIKDVRERIEQAVEAVSGSASTHLTKWLQVPTDSSFKRAVDSDCRVRARAVGALLSPDGKPYNPTSLSSSIAPKKNWEAIDKQLKSGYAVIVEGTPSHVCGEKSYFIIEGGIGFHVLVFLAVGIDSKERCFYLGFDPDVSATEDARARWTKIAPASVKTIDDTDQSTKIIKVMLLGESPDVFGPLIRKYYVDTSKLFPGIRHV